MAKGVYPRTGTVWEARLAERVRSMNEANRGRPVSAETRKKISLAVRGGKTGRSGAEHHAWLGDKVNYRQLHSWVEREKGKPHYCEHCKNSDLRHRQYQWANKSHKYLRNLEDWIRLCVKCHIAYDAIA